METRPRGGHLLPEALCLGDINLLRGQIPSPLKAEISHILASCCTLKVTNSGDLEEARMTLDDDINIKSLAIKWTF